MQQFIEFFGNHVALFAAFFVVLSLIVANEVHGNVTGGKRLSALEAVRIINDREPLILDIRTAADFKRGHLLNAVSMPVARLESRITELGKDKARPILVYCAMGVSSSEAAAKIRKHGYSEVYPIRGGMNGWLQNSLPVTAK